MALVSAACPVLVADSLRGGGMDRMYGLVSNCVFTCNSSDGPAWTIMAVPSPDESPGHSLAGSVLVDAYDKAYVILDNDTKTITVWGEPEDPILTSDAFGIVNVHLDVGGTDENDIYYPGDTVCRDHGDSTLVGEDETDIDNQGRMDDTVVDIGADELVPIPE